mgnify:CR=1 FL=1
MLLSLDQGVQQVVVDLVGHVILGDQHGRSLEEVVPVLPLLVPEVRVHVFEELPLFTLWIASIGHEG